MPNLENLKKQAKRYVRWHREGRYTVAASLREHLPRLAALTDAEIMARPIRLADAQALVARQAGFESWAALIKGQAMSSEAKTYPNRPVLRAAEPQLFVADIGRSLQFFDEKLGFATSFAYGEPPFYARVVRDGAILNLRCVDRPVMDRAGEEGLLSASIVSTHLKALFLEFQEKGLAFAEPQTRQPWHAPGTGPLIVEDPDGNQIMFTGPTH